MYPACNIFLFSLFPVYTYFFLKKHAMVTTRRHAYIYVQSGLVTVVFTSVALNFGLSDQSNIVIWAEKKQGPFYTFPSRD